ncbi:MAG: sugar ABC transporter ATP-binding protein [Clostridia bacterium]|nr:sugar ABC transporter ATP-binding protein [Clostridia bacterium]
MLQVNNITKQFPGVKALDRVSIDLYEGEVLCIAGENGAGKSTLIKILSGVFMLDEGEIILNDEKVNIKNPLTAIELGFSVVYQEHRLINNLTVAENIYFGRFPMKRGFVDYRKLNDDAQQILNRLGMNIRASELVSSLGSSQSQMVEIAKALSVGAKIMILDEPSAAITDSELEKLFEIIKDLKSEGQSFIYISHRLKELFEIGDRVAVLKDGKLVGVEKVSDIDTKKIISMMVGRDLGEVYRPKDREIKEEVLRVENLTNDIVHDCSFTVRAGEIVGFSGLVGSGRSELAESVFGYRKRRAGDIFVDGRKVRIRTPKDAIANGMGFITEDRKTTGVILNKSVAVNTTFAILDKLSRAGFVNTREEKVLVDNYIKKLKIKTPSDKQEAQFLSGGNQQKVILAKWLLTESKFLICDEPTKGIDVGTKQEFYNILDDLARQGIAIMLISSELPEIVGLSNRVYVMQEGRIVKELMEDEISEETITTYSMHEME